MRVYRVGMDSIFVSKHIIPVISTGNRNAIDSVMVLYPKYFQEEDVAAAMARRNAQ